jgi:UDPglucose--hexose-1-phosphate uridylyltransferase
LLLKQEEIAFEENKSDIFFKAQPERGISRVALFSPENTM